MWHGSTMCAIYYCDTNQHLDLQNKCFLLLGMLAYLNQIKFTIFAHRDVKENKKAKEKHM